MADSMHNIRYDGLSKASGDAFGEIAMRMDTTSAVRLAACSKELRHQVVSRKGRKCPNDDCRTLVAFHDFLNHNMACPHSPCNCTEPGCEFAAPPTALFAHLEKAHSIEVQSFHYGEEHRYISQPLLAPGSWRVETVVSGDDDTLFIVRFDMLDYGLAISVQCVRSAACLFPRYVVELHIYKPSMIGEDLEEFTKDSLFFEWKSSASPASIGITEDYRNFLIKKHDRFISQPLSAPRSLRLENIISKDDGTVFAVLFDMLEWGKIIISVVCIRSDGCSSPLYNVQFTVYHLSPEARFWEGVVRNSFTLGSRVVPGIMQKEKHSMVV